MNKLQSIAAAGLALGALGCGDDAPTDPGSPAGPLVGRWRIESIEPLTGSAEHAVQGARTVEIRPNDAVVHFIGPYGLRWRQEFDISVSGSIVSVSRLSRGPVTFEIDDGRIVAEHASATFTLVRDDIAPSTEEWTTSLEVERSARHDVDSHGGLAWDGENLWMANIDEPGVQVISLDGFRVLRSFAGHAWYSMAFRDGRVIAAKPGHAEIRTYDPETLEELGTPTVGSFWMSGLASDGDRIWYVGSDPAELALIEPAIGETTGTFPMDRPWNVGEFDIDGEGRLLIPFAGAINVVTATAQNLTWEAAYRIPGVYAQRIVDTGDRWVISGSDLDFDSRALYVVADPMP